MLGGGTFFPFFLFSLDIIEKTPEIYGHHVTCKAEELSAITLAASRKALEAFCSPSAAITYNRKK